MDTHPRRSAGHDRDSRTGPSGASEPCRVRLSDPGQIAAALPYLIGFRPRESLVLVSLTGTGGRRVGLTVRADIPPGPAAAEVAGALAGSLVTDRPRAVLLAVVSEAADVTVRTIGRHGDEEDPATDLPHRPVLGALVRALSAVRVPVREALLVRRGRWWSYDCRLRCCAPEAGTPLPAEAGELAAASVLAGQVVQDDRGALEALIARPRGPAASAMVAARIRIAAECSDRALEIGLPAVAEESWTTVLGAVARCRPGPAAAGGSLTDREVARLAWGLRDTGVRDRALQLCLGDDADAAEALWTECTRRSPAPMDAPPATLLAVSAWLRGDGAMAGIALGRALASDPGYSLARLLHSALAACLPPAELRAVLAASGAVEPLGPLDPGRVDGPAAG